MQLVRRHVVDGDDATAHHRHDRDGRVRRLLADEGLEGLALGARDVGEEEARHGAVARIADLAPDVHVDQGERDQQAEAEAERQDHGGSQRAWPVDVAQRQPPFDAARMGQGAGEAHQAEGDEPQQREGDDRRPDVDGAQPPVGRQQEDRADQRHDGHRDADAIAHTQPCRIGLDHIAKQRGDRDVVRPPERAEREGERRQQSVDGALREFPRIDRRLQREGDDAAEQRENDERQRRTEHEAREDAETGDGEDLREADGEDGAARRAERLQDGEARPFALHGGADRIGDADAAHDQRGQSDERQELGETRQVAVEFRRDVATGADVPARLGKGRLDGIDRPRQAGIGDRRGAVAVEDDARRPAHQRVGAGESGRLQPVERGDHAGTERDAAGQLVGFGHQGRAQNDAGFAELQPVAGMNVEARGDGRIGDEPVGAVRPGFQRLGQRHRWIEHDPSGEWIGAVDRLDIDQRRGAIGAAGHCAGVPGLPDRSVGGDGGDLSGVERGRHAAECGIASKDGATLRRETVGQPIRHRADPGDGGDAERDAAEEDPEPGKPPAQVARRQPQDHRRRHARCGRIGHCAAT